MIGESIFGRVVREIPERCLAGVQSGELKVYGSVIRSVRDGRVVGHLQETSRLAELAGQAVASAPLPGVNGSVDAVGHGVTLVQNEQIKAAIAVVQGLQLATLAVSVVGVGVSVAGFALLSRKIARVEAKVDRIGKTLNALARGVAELQRDQIANDFVRLRAALRASDEAWLLSAPAAQWQHVSAECLYLEGQFERRAGELLAGGADATQVEPFMEAISLAVSGRVHARMASGEDEAARHAAFEGAAALVGLGDRINLGAAVLERVERANLKRATREWDEALRAEVDQLRGSVLEIRARETAAVSACETLRELRSQAISGRAWLEAARAEETLPLLYLPAGRQG